MVRDYNAERLAEHAKNAEVRNKLTEAVKILKQKNTTSKDIEPGDCRVTTDQLFMHFSAGYGTKRIEVSGIYPRNMKGEYIEVYYTADEREALHKAGKPNPYGAKQGPRISISPDKTAAQIARDIELRFMPDYTEHLSRIQKRIDADDDYHTTTLATLTALKGSALSEYEAREYKISGDVERKVEGEYDLRWSIKASRKDVTMEIHNMTPDEAKAVLNLIKKGGPKA